MSTVDKNFLLLYHLIMKKIAVIGGGAAGMSCAVLLAKRGFSVSLLERGERLGRKLSATGNGQGNVTNVRMGAEHYFSDDPAKVARILSRFGAEEAVAFLSSMGGIFLPDARGRVYPAGRQASAVTDLFRRELRRAGVDICLGAQVKELSYDGGFRLAWEGGHMRADAVVLAAGGKAAEHFGTDGSAYALAEGFGHTVSPLSPALVRLRCDPSSVKGLKGIRVDASLSLRRGGKEVFRGRGDVLFTENGISGDAVFRASSYAKEGDLVLLDLLPDVPEERLAAAAAGREEPFLCILNNGLARALYARAKGEELLSLAKNFPLTVRGTAGFPEAQVTKGGIPLRETDENLMSRFREGLYFAGEILDADGECGGYNLHWAFASAYTVAEGMK